MYFLSQIKSQFISQIIASEMPTNGDEFTVGAPEMKDGQEEFSQEQISSMSSSEVLEELKERLDIVKAGEGIVRTKAEVLMRFCEKVKKNEIHGYSTEDKDYHVLVEMVIRSVEEYKLLTGEAVEIDEKIRVELARIGGHIDREITAPEENTILSEEERKEQEEIDRLETQRQSYLGIFNEKVSNIPAYIILPDSFHDSITKGEALSIEKLEGTISENIARITVINSELLDLHKLIDDIVLNNTPDVIYTTRMLGEMTEQSSVHTSDFKTTLLSQVLSEEGTGKELAEYITDERIEALQKEHPKGVAFGYDIADVIKQYSEIELPKLDDVTDENRQERGGKLSAVLEQMASLNRQMDIIARDVQAVEGEKTFGEQRLEITHEGYKEILENEAVKEALSDSNGRVPLFEDLGIDHINILIEKGVNLKKLFLVTESGEQFDGLLSEGEKYIVNFSTNTQLPGVLDFSVIDSGSENIEIDGIAVILDRNGQSGAGYYDIDGNQILLRDGSQINIVKTAQRTEPEQVAVDSGIRDRLENYARESTQYRAFLEAVSSNPSAAFEGKTLPKGLAGWFISTMLNIFDGKNYTKNPDGTYSEKPEGGPEGSPATNAGLVDAHRQGGMTLGSLSKYFESGDKGPHAYVADDNGAGPSYGTYQMNTDKGVYREFAAKYNIAPNQSGWEAKIAEVGEERFKQMEHEFIKEKNYDVMMGNITLPGKENFTIAMQNVIWSSAVQHGPHRRQILDAINNSGITPGDHEGEKRLINDIYDARGRLWEAGINTRYAQERPQALAMLDAAIMSPISAEDLTKYGDTGAGLATWIRQINYRKFVDRPSNCGANVGEALKEFGFTGIPSTGRHGYRWASFLEKHRDFRELTGVTPQTAPAGSIISYKQNSGGTQARQDYGHVEIAMGNNSGYYFGQRNDRPGGSNPNPQAGNYRIFVPISKT